MRYYIIDATNQLVTTECDLVIAEAIASALGGYVIDKAEVEGQTLNQPSKNFKKTVDKLISV